MTRSLCRAFGLADRTHAAASSDQHLRLHVPLKLFGRREATEACLTCDGDDLGAFVQQYDHRLAEFRLNTVGPSQVEHAFCSPVAMSAKS